MDKIKFGIDGWWGIIAKDFTLANVSKAAYGIARWMTNKFQVSTAIVGYDCRFGGEMFMEAIAKILASKGIQVYIPEKYVSSPMISLGVVKLKADCGIIVTASHSPAMYNGIKLKGAHGGPMLEKDVRDIENLISSDYEFDLELLNWNYLLEQGKIQYINLESIYTKHILDNFDIEKLRNSNLKFAFDAMYGGTQSVFRKLMPEVHHFHCEVNPSFNNIPPEPVHKNLHELADFVCEKQDIDCSLAVDADGDRMALYDKEGNYIDSHHIFLLVIHYLAKYQQQSGKVVAGFSCTGKIEKICAHYGFDVVRTRVGFNYIADIMLREDILAGGEENGGITVGTYLPERDGVWMGILIWSWLLESGKSLKEINEEVEAITGSFVFDRIDLTLNKNIRNKILDKCRKGEFTEFGKNKVVKTEDLDGYKFFFGADEWVLVRSSSIYPIIRLYAEAKDLPRVRELIHSVQHVLEQVN
jgi:phosphomannomutase